MPQRKRVDQSEIDVLAHKFFNSVQPVREAKWPCLQIGPYRVEMVLNKSKIERDGKPVRLNISFAKAAPGRKEIARLSRRLAEIEAHQFHADSPAA
jgi:hypothetical protein